MFHGFDYPDECGDGQLHARFWRPTMIDGVIRFTRPENCDNRKLIRAMTVKHFGFGINGNLLDVHAEALAIGVTP